MRKPPQARTGSWLALGLALALLAWAGLPGPAQAQVMADQKCLKCHGEFKDLGNAVAGEFQSRSGKAKSISVEVAEGQNVVIKFTPQTKVINVPAIKNLQKPIPVLVTFTKQGSDLVATEIKAKPQIQVPKEQLIGVKELAALVAQGPDKGKFMLIDSRPPIRYQEGHIPGAVLMPFPKMPDMMGKLPKDKNQLVVFYCGGFR